MRIILQQLASIWLFSVLFKVKRPGIRGASPANLASGGFFPYFNIFVSFEFSCLGPKEILPVSSMSEGLIRSSPHLVENVRSENEPCRVCPLSVYRSLWPRSVPVERRGIGLVRRNRAAHVGTDSEGRSGDHPGRSHRAEVHAQRPGCVHHQRARPGGSHHRAKNEHHTGNTTTVQRECCGLD